MYQIQTKDAKILDEPTNCFQWHQFWRLKLLSVYWGIKASFLADEASAQGYFSVQVLNFNRINLHVYIR